VSRWVGKLNGAVGFVGPAVRCHVWASVVSPALCIFHVAFVGFRWSCALWVKVRSSPGLVFSAHWGKPSYFGGWLLGFGCVTWPNSSLKGTRRPLAVLNIGFYHGFGVSLGFIERRAP